MPITTQPPSSSRVRTVYAEGGGILPDWWIREYVTIEPRAERLDQDGAVSWGPSSFGYDARLGDSFALFRNDLDSTAGETPAVIDPKAFNPKLVQRFRTSKPWEIPPHSFVLGESLETFTIPEDVLGICLGKSSYCRCGLVLNCTPLEAAWKGVITIELVNTTSFPVRIYPGEGVMQVIFLRGMGRCETTYADRKGRYQGQTGLTLPFVRQDS